MQDRNELRSRIVGVNMPRGERIATGLAGGVAFLIGMRRPSLAGFATAGIGAVLMVRAVTGRCPMYRARALRKGIQVRRAITIQGTPSEIYNAWRDLEKLPRFMHHVRSVTVEGDGISRWVVKEGPKELEWRAEIVEDSPGRRLRWRSLPGGDLVHEGSVEIRALKDRGTVVEVKLRYFPPGGLFVASALAGFLRRVTTLQIGYELARLQQLIETGEITTSARRLDEVDDDRALGISDLVSRPPLRSAQTSSWGDASGVIGGAR